MDTNKNTQNPKVGRPKGSKSPERIKSERIRLVQPVINEMDDLELSHLRGLVGHKLALRNNLSDEPARKLMARQNRIIIALDDVDLRLRELGKPGLRTTTEYDEHRSPDSPSLSSIYKVFGNWKTALVEAGIAAVSRPEAHLLRIDGRPAGGGHSFSETEKIEAVALVLERFHGRLFSYEAYDETREMLDRPLPSAAQIVGRKSGSKATRSWDEARELAIAYILEHPARYPRAAAYLTQTRCLRSERAA